MIDEERAIILERRHGKEVADIARDHRTTEMCVNMILDRHAERTITRECRVRTLALELDRLDEMMKAAYPKALAGDVQYINAVGKLIERRCLLLGLNQPAPVRAAELLPDSALPAQTSTDRIRTAIDRIRAKALPQPN